MDIIQINHLGRTQKREIQHLIDKCNEYESLERTLYLESDINDDEGLDSFYLLYLNGKLISIVSIYFPEDNVVEISGYTMPEYRQKGYFMQLLDKVLNALHEFPSKQVLFVTEPKSLSAISTMQALQGKYVKSEYVLTLDLLHAKINQRAPMGLDIRTLKFKEIDEAVEINTKTLNMKREEAEFIYHEIMKANDLECYCALFHNEMVGICGVSYGNCNASIFGFGVEEKYQGLGYGRELITHVIQLVKDKGYTNLSLQVGSQSSRAVTLYKHMGFSTKTQYDYYQFQ
jgi:ribosomal protein S18 acetylase RimI-like enzyme